MKSREKKLSKFEKEMRNGRGVRGNWMECGHHETTSKSAAII